MAAKSENQVCIYPNSTVLPITKAGSVPISPNNEFYSCALEYLLIERQLLCDANVSVLKESLSREPFFGINNEHSYAEDVLSPSKNIQFQDNDSFNCTKTNSISVVSNNVSSNTKFVESDDLQFRINCANDIKSREIESSTDDGAPVLRNECMDNGTDIQRSSHGGENDGLQYPGNMETKSILDSDNKTEPNESELLLDIVECVYNQCEREISCFTQESTKGTLSDRDVVMDNDSDDCSDCESTSSKLSYNVESKSNERNCTVDDQKWMLTRKNDRMTHSAENLHEPGYRTDDEMATTDVVTDTYGERISNIKRGIKSSSLFFESSVFGSAIILGSNEKIKHDTVRRYDLLRPLGTFKKPRRDESATKSSYLKNLLVMSVCYMFIFIATGSVNNLQSSVNHEGGVGLLSMAISFAGWTLFSMVSSPLVLRFNPKLCMIIGFVIQTLYVLSNLYPKPYLLIPMSGLVGISMAVLWNAMSTYVITLSKYQASDEGTLSEHVSGKFYGIFFLFFQFAFVLGNLVSSIVLLYMKPNSVESFSDTTALLVNHTGANADVISGFNKTNTNESDSIVFPYHLCGSKYCHSYEIDHASMNITQQSKYVLFGIFAACCLVAIVIVGIFLESFKPFNAQNVNCRYTIDQLKRTCKLLLNRWFLAVLPINIFSSLQNGFAVSELTKAFITCPLGLGMVGYLMAFLAFCSSISSISAGCIGKYIGRVAIILTASVVNLGCLLVMFLWQPVPSSLYPFFGLFGAWGIANGIWSSVLSTLMGILFENRVEESYACHRFVQGIALSASYFYAQHLCMEAKMYILIGMCILGSVTYWITEHFLKKWKLRQLDFNVEV